MNSFKLSSFSKNIILIIFYFFACVSTKEKLNEKIEQNDNKEIKAQIESKVEEKIDLLLLSQNISANSSGKVDNDFFNIKYNIELSFKTDYSVKKVDIKLTDSYSNQLNEKIKIDYNKAESNLYHIKADFISKLSYKKINYLLMVTFKDGTFKEVNGELDNKLFPSVEELFFGPVISQYVNNKLRVSLKVKIYISNCLSIKWARVIPPSKDFFWELPVIDDAAFLKCEGILYDKDNNYISNGKYIIQLNFGEYGVYEKELVLTDYLGNIKGINYGLPVLEKIVYDKENLNLNLPLLDKIDELEILIFSEIKTGVEPYFLGSFKTIPVNAIPMKLLKESFLNSDGKKVKLLNNHQYLIKINVYSKNINGVTYLSMSDYMPIKFFGFSLPFFN